MRDGQDETIVTERRWIPQLVLRAGRPIVPSLRLARDVVGRRYG